VFSDPGGSSTAGKKTPARDSESLAEERPARETPKSFFKIKKCSNLKSITYSMMQKPLSKYIFYRI
jgi:hypothetical protein